MKGPYTLILIKNFLLIINIIDDISKQLCDLGFMKIIRFKS